MVEKFPLIIDVEKIRRNGYPQNTHNTKNS